jgi:hypothetical protein
MSASGTATGIGGVYVDEVSGAGFGNVLQHGFRKIAVRIEQCEALAGKKVLPDQVEKQGAFSGAGLPDDVEMSAAFLGIEHGGLARYAGADAKLLCGQCHGRKGAGVPCASQVGR